MNNHAYNTCKSLLPISFNSSVAVGLFATSRSGVGRTRLRFLFATAFVVCSSVALAQPIQKESIPDHYRALQWDHEDGMSHSHLGVMIKDAHGFIWSGSISGALCRFDGATFKKYIPAKDTRGSINSDKIWALTEDSLHNIWIGTMNGLSRYDIQADTFTNIEIHADSDSASSLAQSMSYPFWATKDEVFCIEAGLWITSYNIHSLERKPFVQLTRADNVMEGFSLCYPVYDESSHTVWMLANSATDRNHGGLLQISLSDASRKHYSWSCRRVGIEHRHSAEAMQYDPQRNSIWINSGDGLIEFSLVSKQFRHITACDRYIQIPDYDRYVGIDLDRDGRIWFATRPKGILIYDPKTDQIQELYSDPDLLAQTGQHNLHIYCDRDGIVWSSYYLSYGLYAFLPYDPLVVQYDVPHSFGNSLSKASIISILPGAKGKLWIGTWDGIQIFDPALEQFEVLRTEEHLGIEGPAFPVYVDTTGHNALLAEFSKTEFYHNNRLFFLEMSSHKASEVLFRDSQRKFDTVSIWPNFVTPYKSGIILFEDFKGIFELKSNSLVAELVFPVRIGAKRLVLVKDRYFFISRAESLPNMTLENINGTWTHIPHRLDSLEWNYMLYNEVDQTYWINSMYELVHYTDDFEILKSFKPEDGYGSPLFNMQLDNEGDLWFVNGTNQIGRIDHESGIITILSEADGYQKQRLNWSVPGIKSKDGDIYFGTGEPPGNGLFTRIQPQKFLSKQTSQVYIQGITVNQQPFVLGTNVNTLEHLSLGYRQNSIKIEIGVIDFYAQGKGRLRYKLESSGNNEIWQYGSAYTPILFDGLSPGSYRLLMQASNASGEFNSPERLLVISISPPYWQTWWFRIVAACLGILMIYTIVQFRSRSLKKRNIVLEEKVLLRTNELNQSLESLKSTQQQLIQSEKMASLGELTAGIAHEIQNPLNFVNNFSDVSNELLEEMKEEVDKGNFAEVKAIANDVKQNLEKILHHGKRADAIVKGMLQHSRSRPGVKEPTDINALADEYLRLAYHGLRAKDKSFNATMNTDFDQTLGMINVVPQDIGRVILNLITNAFYAVTERANGDKQSTVHSPQSSVNSQQPEASSQYEPTVTVTTKNLGDKIEIRVKDNGIGIPEHIKDKIFQPFFTTKPTGQGTGLGLSLSYDIIKAHGGEMTVRSTKDFGTQFSIILPLT